MLFVSEDLCKSLGLDENLKAKLEALCKLNENSALTLHKTDRLCLTLDNDPKLKPLCFDFLSDKFIYRLNQGGRKKENLAKAVMSGLSSPIVFDATAGMGRDSFILQHAGCKVYMFERNIVIWLLLRDALQRAIGDATLTHLVNPFPILMSCGEVACYTGDIIPDVIYYDPMFPERKKSALVKKEMRIFKELIGADEDIEATLRILVQKARHKVILKRPQTAKPIFLDKIKPIGSVDGGACRFDIYMHQDLL